MSKSNKKNPPLYQYHPIRFAAIREPYITEAVNILLRDCRDGAHPIFLLPPQTQKETDTYFYKLILNHIASSTSKELYPTYLRKMYKMCESYYTLGNEAGSELLYEYLQTYYTDDLIIFEQNTSFNYYGKNIFEFPPHLLELFSQTDVDSVLTKDILLPFGTIYVHFGKQENIKVYGNISYIVSKCKSQLPFTANNQEDIHFLLDGAYISQHPEANDLKIAFTSVKNQASKFTSNCVDSYEEIVSIVLKQASTDMTIKEGVESIRKILRHDKVYQTSQLDIDTTINQIIEYLKLAINCALYLQSYPDDITEDYPTEAPANLVTQTKRNSGVKAIAEKKLTQLGYKKIKFCGKRRASTSFPTIDTERALTDDDSERTVQPHRRRAHLRKQRYGTNLQSWRYIWIKESIIHKDKYQNSSPQYRIYEVSE
ncbi:hypothetical protein CAL7716_101060 (plasmid) [Calothrix sp. PCC 7716]|nr:hypothetical protein CAL7716_101060 [Calothrix sp. PCC 7716]